ncbi:MAG: hypothetical protein IT160_20995 [Bryobacterales bacterium]|nr:hypothetical protein [Bryobacterales bacterium]
MRFRPSVFSIALSFLTVLPVGAANFHDVVIETGARAGEVERNVAQLLAERISRPAGIAVRVESEGSAVKAAPGELLILLGMPEHHRALARALDDLNIPKLTWLEPGAEGFVLQSARRGERTVLVAAGIDPRGVLYAAGEILRRMTMAEGSFDLPEQLRVRTAPAFEVRGTQFGQSSVALTRGKVRRWTFEDRRRAILDFALAGLNTMEVGAGAKADDETYRLLKSFGLKTLVHYGPNTGSGPKEWQATESIGRGGYLCPSVPAAREALLARCEETFRNAHPVDYVRFVGGDGGGCECDRCKPYGLTYIRLCADMAKIILRYHPATQFFATNQKFDNDDDTAIFDYLRRQPVSWLRAFAYGPGSDAMSWQPGHRQTHRMDLFRYPGFGPYDRYLKEILHQLPGDVDIVFFNELTHWRYSQNGYIQAYPRADRNGDRPPHWNDFLYRRRPDPALTMVYDRLTFFAWPRYYHWVFGQTMRYGIGDVTHSSGTQDHFNQWMWQRLMWAPLTSLDDVMAEYARTWFGREAAPEMARAILQLEENLAAKPGVPTEKKEGFDRYYRLVRDAGAKMPAWRMKNDWLWREYMQKAALDKHIQLSVRQQAALRERIEKVAAASPTDTAIRGALTWFGELRPSPEMKRLEAEAARLGEESNRLNGVRSEGIFNLQHDFVGLGWYKRQLERALAAKGERRAELLHMITNYTDAGEGGFYDAGGTLDRAPHITAGYPYDFGQPIVPDMLWEGNLPSQRMMHYTQDEDQGVTLRYRGLDGNAEYRIRFTLVRPAYQERYAMRMNQKTETIYAGGLVLAKDLAVPLKMSDYFTFDIPRGAIRNGELEIRFERAADVARGSRVEREQWRNSGGWGTLMSEAWLMKKPRPAARLRSVRSSASSPNR